MEHTSVPPLKRIGKEDESVLVALRAISNLNEYQEEEDDSDEEAFLS